MKRRIWLAAVCVAGLLAQSDRPRELAARRIHGTITANGSPAEGAAVQLKNLKTLQVRSFLTGADGKYQFQNLPANVEYEVRASREGWVSNAKTVDLFDDRVEIVINLKLEPPKR